MTDKRDNKSKEIRGDYLVGKGDDMKVIQPISFVSQEASDSFADNLNAALDELEEYQSNLDKRY
ncbi:hypothetical protein [Lacticaseibacillus saniviri]|uniref:Uncharacterized protein n=1 Tax=Lacticaseibacillus saniviri JCM 17471 = DSM 24301 TaxID=1293598 RepID=A0A0R2MXT3_9LACO|nr:hypothetical protein [Lacticaseibacillus saniviri]KRO16637.1 hypothetical protein IV56_GL001083 [Lacticaseibacillus saniviri JCM 17471 = DSM 24301]